MYDVQNRDQYLRMHLESLPLIKTGREQHHFLYIFVVPQILVIPQIHFTDFTFYFNVISQDFRPFPVLYAFFLRVLFPVAVHCSGMLMTSMN